MLKKSFNGHKICEALSDPTRTQIFKQLIQVYPKAQTITEIEKVLSKHVSATTVSFHLKKLREAGLITTNGHKKGFRATRKMLIIDFNNKGFHIKEE